jgi:GntR family transcriptional regulator, trigonelline degradation regulator
VDVREDPLAINMNRRMGDEVYTRLRDAIVTGYFAPGARVIERDLTDRLKVSRTPIREALKQLEQERLIVCYPHKGCFVRSPTFEEARQAYELRRMAEGFSAELAAERATREELEVMSTAIRKSSEALQSGNRPTMLLHNNEFHQAQAKAAGNLFLYEELHRLWAYVDILRGHYWTSTDRPSTTQVEHEAILDAMKRRDGATARRLSEIHVQNAWSLLSTILNKESSPPSLGDAIAD